MLERRLRGRKKVAAPGSMPSGAMLGERLLPIGTEPGSACRGRRQLRPPEESEIFERSSLASRARGRSANAFLPDLKEVLALMAEFAQFVAVIASDDSVILPDPQTGDIDIGFRNIEFADLDRSRTALAMFKVGGEGTARLRMRFNAGNDHFIDFTSSSGAARTWHEVFRGEDLQVSNNELVVSVSQLGLEQGLPYPVELGRVQLSDIVVFYHARTP
jgi:hypothetical protein